MVWGLRQEPHLYQVTSVSGADRVLRSSNFRSKFCPNKELQGRVVGSGQGQHNKLCLVVSTDSDLGNPPNQTFELNYKKKITQNVSRWRVTWLSVILREVRSVRLVRKCVKTTETHQDTVNTRRVALRLIRPGA